MKQDLFDLPQTENLLPCDGTVIYHGRILSTEDSHRYFDTLLTGIPWRHDEAVIFGKHITTARQVAWYGDGNYAYAYSGTTKQALAWTPELRQIKSLVEGLTGTTFNSCLLNLYHDGSEGVGWHSDDEKSLQKHMGIASISLGAERKFCFRHKRTQQAVSLMLEDGSLLMMKDETQTHWLHCLPKSAKIKTPRINLTFRTMINTPPSDAAGSQRPV